MGLQSLNLKFRQDFIGPLAIPQPYQTLRTTCCPLHCSLHVVRSTHWCISVAKSEFNMIYYCTYFNLAHAATVTDFIISVLGSTLVLLITLIQSPSLTTVDCKVTAFSSCRFQSILDYTQLIAAIIASTFAPPSSPD